MLIDTKRVMAVRCPRCGRIEVRDCFLFELYSKKTTLVCCECGQALIEMERHSHLYKVEIDCLVCETRHELLVDVKSIVHNDALVLFCPESDIDLAMIGRCERVRELLAGEGDLLANVVVPGAIDSAFVDIEIMREVLERLQAWANAGQLYCGCGNRQLELDLFSEKVEVVCSECGGTLVIYAEREEDLAAMEGLEEVVLKKGAFTCIDSADFRCRHRV